MFPGNLALSAVVNLFTGDTSAVTPSMWLYLVVGSLLVGFNEEMATSGQLIVALRSASESLACGSSDGRHPGEGEEDAVHPVQQPRVGLPGQAFARF